MQLMGRTWKSISTYTGSAIKFTDLDIANITPCFIADTEITTVTPNVDHDILAQSSSYGGFGMGVIGAVFVKLNMDDGDGGGDDRVNGGGGDVRGA
ncbi:hypothetical protein K470DRAFT_257208 [Piedraia hortae CBS 480.64]|uniref:Uncharacterized protein n=1 Tax=Piedraia hortae CBS 480.64 TaxID=1314780 RepID=A0A6A7C0H1_9PEZI|nr:hypothetical protein K470DRAFT_257208 [Piedraia hortae CBS 480.64]